MNKSVNNKLQIYNLPTNDNKSSKEQHKPMNNKRRLIIITKNNEEQCGSSEQQKIKLNNQIIQNYICYYSKFQQVYKLKYETLFLAIILLKKYYLTKNHTSIEPQQAIACLTLAMKFQQIYPPEYSQLVKLFRIQQDLVVLLKNQKKIFKCMNYNLNIKGPHFFMEKFKLCKLQNEPLQIQAHLFYLLQLAYLDTEMLNQFDIQDIFQSIEVIFSSYLLKDQKIQSEKIKKCTKKLIMLKNNKEKYSFIHKKYSHQSYGNCSIRPFLKLTDLP